MQHWINGVNELEIQAKDVESAQEEFNEQMANYEQFEDEVQVELQEYHERIDGLGYPRGLKDDEIHKYTKILSVVDVFDAVTNPRAYRPSMLPHKGLELLYAGNGTQFDSKQIQLFKDCIAIYPQGLTVKINDGRTGIVSKYNFHAAGRPEIRIIRNEEGGNMLYYKEKVSPLSSV
jgi:HD-GYP domain-containing protein (c-di-GMP phosphodiesterase class II)